MPRNHSINRERIFVSRDRPWRPYLVGLGLAALVIGLPAISWWLTDYYTGQENRRLQEALAASRAEVEQLETRVDELRQQRKDLEVAARLDMEAIDQLRRRLVEWREANARLEEQNQFYMSLMNPGSDDAGVFIESIEIESTAQPREYQYDVLVAQRSVDHDRVRGRALLTLEGRRNGELATLTLDTEEEAEDGQSLGFRYFQHVRGNVRLPENFQPVSLRVRVFLSGRNAPEIDTKSDWPAS